MITDKRSLEILNFLLSENCDVNYKIISKQDIINALPEKRQVNTAVLDSVLKSLEARQFITTKFNDSDEICVNLTVKGSAAVQNELEYVKEKLLASVNGKFYLILGAVCFAMSFLGALAAQLVGKLF